jgi:hypothetical protein
LNRVLRCLAVSLLAATSLARAAEGVRVLQVHPIDARKLVPPATGTHQLKLYAHMFQGTRWKPDDVVGAVVGAARLLVQCGITLTAAELRVVEAPAPFRYFDTPRSRELLRSLDAPRPAVFFVEDTKNDPAFDAEAVGHANSARRPELVNTVWVAHGARDLPFALAHELVHVLSDSGEHTDEPRNLMRSDTAPENTQLNAAQCERMRSRGEANGLLRNHAR